MRKNMKKTPITDSSEEETLYIMSSEAMMEIIKEGKEDIERGNFNIIDIKKMWI